MCLSHDKFMLSPRNSAQSLQAGNVLVKEKKERDDLHALDIRQNGALSDPCTSPKQKLCSHPSTYSHHKHNVEPC